MPRKNGSSSRPLWTEEFSVHAAEDSYVLRRQFTKFLVLTSFGMVAGNAWIWVKSLFADEHAVLPEAIIGRSTDIVPGGVRLFHYPTENDPAILVRKPDGQLAAFSQKCTHLSCAVYYEIDGPIAVGDFGRSLMRGRKSVYLYPPHAVEHLQLMFRLVKGGFSPKLAYIMSAGEQLLEAVSDEWSTLGKKISYARQAAGLSYTELGNFLDMPREQVLAIESGLVRIDAISLYKIARTLNVALDELLSHVDDVDSSKTARLWRRFSTALRRLVGRGFLARPPLANPSTSSSSPSINAADPGMAPAPTLHKGTPVFSTRARTSGVIWIAGKVALIPPRFLNAALC